MSYSGFPCSISFLALVTGSLPGSFQCLAGEWFLRSVLRDTSALCTDFSSPFLLPAVWSRDAFTLFEDDRPLGIAAALGSIFQLSFPPLTCNAYTGFRHFFPELLQPLPLRNPIFSGFLHASPKIIVQTYCVDHVVLFF